MNYRSAPAPNRKPPEPQPPKWRLRLYEERSRLQLSDLPPLKDPLEPEERTAELTALYRRAANTVEPAEFDILCAEVENLLAKEEKSRGVPRFSYEQPRISLEQLAQELGFSTQEALTLLEGRPVPRKGPLSGGCVLEGQEILDLQSALVQAKLDSLPEAPAAARSPRRVTPVVVAAERDAPSLLMDFDALSALYRGWADQRKALKQRHNTAVAPYRRELSNPARKKVCQSWVGKYTAMDKLLRQRKAEVISRQKAKSEYWQERIIDRWKANHPLLSEEERAPLRDLPPTGRLAFGLRVLVLLLCQIFFSCCNILNEDWGGSFRVPGYLVTQLRSLPDMPDALTDYADCFTGNDLFSCVLFLVAAVLCCALFHRFCGTGMRRMRSWLPLTLVTFFFANTLLYPLLPFGGLSRLLLAPAATLLHIVIALLPYAGSRGSARGASLHLPAGSDFRALYRPMNAAANLLTFVLFWVVQLYIALRVAVAVLGYYNPDDYFFPFDNIGPSPDRYFLPITVALLILAGAIVLVPTLRELFLAGPFHCALGTYLQLTECMLAAYAAVLLAGQLAGRIPVLGSYLDLSVLGISQLWRWAAALLLARFLHERFGGGPSSHVLNTLLLAIVCVLQVSVVYLVLTDLFNRGYRFFDLGPFRITLPVLLALIMVCARVMRAPFENRIGCRDGRIAFLYLLFIVFWLVTAGPASVWLGGILPPMLPDCAHLASAVYFTALHVILLLICCSPIFG